MIDFGMLPPEINSGRMYTGAGAGPLLAAATTWDTLAEELSSTAAMFESTIADLTGGPWRGPASMSMSDAAMPFATWLKTTAGQAEQAASQAKAAVAAYEAAFAMTVPPPVIAANRAQLMSLIATNFFGQNTPAIAATEAHYAAMWAQDATAMYGYAGSSKAAMKVSPFTPPPHTTNPAGLATHAATVGHAAGSGHGLPATMPSAPAHPTSPVAGPPHPFADSAASTATGSPAAVPPGSQAGYDYWSLFNQYTQAPTSPVQFANVGMRFLFSGHEFPKAYSGVNGFLGDAAKAAESAAKSAGMSSALMPSGGAIPAVNVSGAAQVGALSVPPSWPGAAPAANPATATLVASRAAAGAAGGAEGASRGMFGMPGVPGAAAAGGGYSLRFVPRYGYRHRVMTRPPDGKSHVS